jgi:hypothetical protein
MDVVRRKRDDSSNRQGAAGMHIGAPRALRAPADRVAQFAGKIPREFRKKSALPERVATLG